MKESTIQKAIRVELTKPGSGVFVTRCNTGLFLPQHGGAPVRCGLGNGTPDLVGCISDPNSPYFGRGFCLETKTPAGRIRPDQIAWATAARKRGVFVAVVRSVDEARAARGRAMAGLLS